MEIINNEIIEVKTPMVTKYNPFPVIGTEGIKFLYEFTMYTTYEAYKVPPFRFQGALRQGTVRLQVYGLITRKVWFEGAERREFEVDMGSLSAQPYLVNALLQQLCRTKFPSSSDPDVFLAELVKKETFLWDRNDWGNPFGKVAETKLKKLIHAEEGDMPRTPKDSTDIIALLSNMLKINPIDGGASV